MRFSKVVRASDSRCRSRKLSRVRSQHPPAQKVEYEGRQMKQCWIKYLKILKISLTPAPWPGAWTWFCCLSGSLSDSAALLEDLNFYPLSTQAMRIWWEASVNGDGWMYCDWMNECMYVINNQNKQKEWHPATKPLKKKKKNFYYCCLSERRMTPAASWVPELESCCLSGSLCLTSAACLGAWIWLLLPVSKREVDSSACLEAWILLESCCLSVWVWLMMLVCKPKWLLLPVRGPKFDFCCLSGGLKFTSTACLGA
jgi:hypothetical protein